MPILKKRDHQTESRLLLESDDPIDLPPAEIADNAVLVQFMKLAGIHDGSARFHSDFVGADKVEKRRRLLKRTYYHSQSQDSIQASQVLPEEATSWWVVESSMSKVEL